MMTMRAFVDEVSRLLPARQPVNVSMEYWDFRGTGGSGLKTVAFKIWDRDAHIFYSGETPEAALARLRASLPVQPEVPADVATVVDALDTSGLVQ